LKKPTHKIITLLVDLTINTEGQTRGKMIPAVILGFMLSNVMRLY
ncbi:mCG1030323, partial [Mus musculus]